MTIEDLAARIAELPASQSLVVVTSTDNALSVLETLPNAEAIECVTSLLPDVVDRKILEARTESQTGTMLSVSCD